MNELYEMYPECLCDRPDGCRKAVKQYLEVSVPVEIFPETEVGKIETECVGDPKVICEDCKKKPDACRLTVVQKVCVKVPLKYVFKTESGQSKTECDGCKMK